MVSQVGVMDELAELKAAFTEVDQYQPVYRLEEKLKEKRVSRDCIDRCQFLEKRFGRDIPNLRILDVGCSMGYLSLYFADRGAVVTGIDNNPSNITFTRALAKVHRISATFEQVEFGPEYCAAIQKGQYDVVFLFSVLHHVIPKYGLPAVQNMMRQLLDKADFLFVELARRDENVPFEWKDKIPEKELEIFAGIDNLKIDLLGEFPALGAKTTRPLYLVQRTTRVLNGLRHSPVAVQRSAIKTGETKNRKYYLSDSLFTKSFIFDGKRSDTYYRFISEVEVYRRIGRHPNFLPMLGSDIEGKLGLITFPRAKGESLLSAIPAGRITAIRPTALAIVSILKAFSDAGLYWNDFRTHNILVSEQGIVAVDFEIALPIEIENTLNLLLWMLLDLQHKQLMTQQNEVFKNGSANVPRPPFKVDDYAPELRDIAALAFGSRDIKDFLSKARFAP